MHWNIRCEYDDIIQKHIIHRKCPKCGDIKHDISVEEMYSAECPNCGQKMELLENEKANHAIYWGSKEEVTKNE